MRVAVPWSLSHYIPMNGFHPLYRALIESPPAGIELYAWDNVALHNHLRVDKGLRKSISLAAKKYRQSLSKYPRGSISRLHEEEYFSPNRVLTQELNGKIEFHHTALYPSLERPFVFHCESFAPIFLPFMTQGSGEIENYEQIREHYYRILTSPLCLGIYSHIPNTLESLRKFFPEGGVDQKLLSSRIGLYEPPFLEIELAQEIKLVKPRFLFINSAHQNPKNFFNRGGHIVLRFWEHFRKNGREGQLILRCSRPEDRELIEHGVSLAMLNAETGISIFWAEDYLTDRELNLLMSSTQFLLLPSFSLHSVSIMQAMRLGIVPVVTDTVGTSVYVEDGKNGIVLEGMRKAIWSKDPNTGVLVDQMVWTKKLDDFLLAQMMERIIALLDHVSDYNEIRNRALDDARVKFAGDLFSKDFWLSAAKEFDDYAQRNSQEMFHLGRIGNKLKKCVFQKEEYSSLFESVPQPMRKIYTGQSIVWELGGAYLHSFGNPDMRLKDWSVFAQYFDITAPKITFAKSLNDFEGMYLSFKPDYGSFRSWRVTALILKLLPHYLSESLSKLLEKVNDVPPDGTPYLVMENVNGFNIVEYQAVYYAIPLNEGEFSLKKIKANRYTSHYQSESLFKLLETVNDVPPDGTPYLVKENVNGFNIVRQAQKYYGVRQQLGEFAVSKISFYSNTDVIVGESISEVAEAIKQINISDKN